MNKVMFALFLCLCLGIQLLSRADGLNTYTNSQLGFSFQYPASWSVATPVTPKSRAKVISNDLKHYAECAVIVQQYPQLASVSQQKLDMVFSVPPATAELASALSQKFNDVEVLAASVGTLGTHPAHTASVRYNIGSPENRYYVSGRILSTATPGFTWTLTCGGQARTKIDAEHSYQFWQLEILRITSSFKYLGLVLNRKK